MTMPTIDDVKHWWNLRPCNVKHSSLTVGTAEYFREVTRKKYFVEPHIPLFANHSEWAGKRVLELGTGIGTDAEQFARAGANYTGIDLSERSIAICEQRFRVFDLSGRFLVGDMERLGEVVPGERFDLIYAFGSIHHTPSPEEAVNDIYEHLVPGGECRAMIYHSESWKAAMIAAGIDQPEAQSGCPIANTYTRQQAHDLFRRFSSVTTKVCHIFRWQIEPYLRGEFTPQPWFAAMPPDVFAAAEASLGWHMLIVAKKSC